MLKQVFCISAMLRSEVCKWGWSPDVRPWVRGLLCKCWKKTLNFELFCYETVRRICYMYISKCMAVLQVCNDFPRNRKLQRVLGIHNSIVCEACCNDTKICNNKNLCNSQGRGINCWRILSPSAVVDLR